MSEEQKQPAVKEEVKAEDKKEVIIPAKFKSLVAEIEKMSVLDLAELVKILEEKFGVSAAAPVMMASPSGAGGGAGEAAVEAKDSFNVELTAAGDNKIGVIKVVREVTGKGLKEAKDLTEGAPVIIKEAVKKEAAEEIKKKLEAIGASASLK